MNRPEQQLQISAFRWLRYQYPKVLAFHPANEGTRDARRGAIMKAMGVVAGAPDVLIFAQSPIQDTDVSCYGQFYCGLAIELKAPKGGKSTPAQLKVQQQLRDAGWRVHADIRTFDEFQKIVTDYLGK